MPKEMSRLGREVPSLRRPQAPSCRRAGLADGRGGTDAVVVTALLGLGRDKSGCSPAAICSLHLQYDELLWGPDVDGGEGPSVIWTWWSCWAVTADARLCVHKPLVLS